MVPGVGVWSEDARALLGFLISIMGLGGPGMIGVGAKMQEQRV